MISILLQLLIGFSFANSSYDINKLEWLAGNWTAPYGSNTLELTFTTASGGSILSTYKMLGVENQLYFKRFLSIEQQDNDIYLKLYPFLQESPDSFKVVKLSETEVVFERVYENKNCDVADPSMAANDDEEKQQACDRFPITITYEKASQQEFKESFYGFKPKEGKQIDVSFARSYTR